MVVETIRQLRKKLLTKEQILEWDKHEVFPEAVVREMLGPEIGLQLLFIPEEYGGMGGGALDCCAVTREMARICLGVGTAFFAIQLGSDPILVGATDEQKKSGWALSPRVGRWWPMPSQSRARAATWRPSRPRPSRSPKTAA
jgi:alkylation response protein AidB-like acyl-CoA dehydrogenase